MTQGICNHVRTDGRAFCPDCGHRVEPEAPDASPTKAAPEPGDATAPSAQGQPPSPTTCDTDAKAPSVALVEVKTGRMWSLGPGKSLLIGRDAKAEVCLDDDSYASREHARLLVTERGLEIHDLDSANGVLVRRKAAVLEPGDEMYIGSTRFRLDMEAKP